jgi:8-oxo-dGTP pyrophosphatase MutT (NUDIX family)
MTTFDLVCDQVKAKLSRLGTAEATGTSAQHAAVALILRSHLGAPELLMIQRAIRENDHWSGHLALPGGRWQSADADLLRTAIRETFEEIGMDLASGGQLLGRLDTLRPRNRLIPKVDVTPFVFTAPPAFHSTTQDAQPQSLVLNHEVARAFWVSVAYLKSEGLSDAFRFIIKGEERSWPAYPSEHGPIWGLTERMLTTFLALID